MLEWNKYNGEINNLKLTATERMNKCCNKNVSSMQRTANEQQIKTHNNCGWDRNEHKTMTISLVIRRIVDWNHYARHERENIFLFSLCPAITDCNLCMRTLYIRVCVSSVLDVCRWLCEVSQCLCFDVKAIAWLDQQKHKTIKLKQFAWNMQRNSYEIAS